MACLSVGERPSQTDETGARQARRGRDAFVYR
jgi:hypothetical protein